MNRVEVLNRIAFIFLIIGKVCGLLGLIVACLQFKSLGASLLFVDGVFIFFALSVCLYSSSLLSKAESSEKQIIERLHKEGTLKQYMKDLNLTV